MGDRTDFPPVNVADHGSTCKVQWGARGMVGLAAKYQLCFGFSLAARQAYQG